MVHNFEGLISSRINAVSITELKWAENPVDLRRNLQASDKDQNRDGFPEIAGILDDPPVQHIRLRTSEISASDEEFKLDGTVSSRRGFS